MSAHQFKQSIRAYPLRYSKIAFDELHDMLQNDELQRDYIAWKSGIDYKTHRKITIGSNLHLQLADKFMIQYPHNYIQGHSFEKKPVLFADLIDIDVNDYLQKTKKIKSDIDEFNAKINNHNDVVKNVIQ
jgi:23S rRNA G2445 N2-methylase RlmL